MKEKSFKVNIIDSRVSKPKSSNKQAIRHGADVVSMARAMEINQGRNQLEMRRENNIGETSTDPSNPPPIIMRHRLKSRLLHIRHMYASTRTPIIMLPVLI